MAKAQTTMLFCPPLPPLRLGASDPISIGRHPSCELALCKDDVSRRHAEIRSEAGGFVIRDLGSTNGTFVNGEPVSVPRRLAPGDTIGIGPFDVSFCSFDQIDPAGFGALGDGDQTVISERPAAQRQSLHGELSEVPTMALFQLLEMGCNSGRLVLDSSDGSLEVWFEMGRAIHAKTDKSTGFEAAIEAIGVREGQFRFGPDQSDIEHTIDASTTELLLEACRLADEADGAENTSSSAAVDNLFD